MRYASRTAIKATLQVGENPIPVVVDAREVVNLRDRRGHYKGYLWSTQMPVSASLEGPLTLVFPSGETKVIRVFSQYTVSPSSAPGLWEFFEASFISDSNVRT